MFPLRIRRVKCDEAKPSCQRCIKTGRTCDGYVITRERKPSHPSQRRPVLSRAPSSGNVSPRCRARSKQSMQIFREVYAPILASHGTAGFWNSVVLQACFANEGIKHLVIASVNIDYAQVANSQSTNVAFLTYYGKALRALRSTSQDAMVATIACILLALCDELQNRPGSAQSHIQAGIRILSAQDEPFLHLWDHTSIMTETLSTLSCLSMPRLPLSGWLLPF